MSQAMGWAAVIAVAAVCAGVSVGCTPHTDASAEAKMPTVGEEPPKKTEFATGDGKDGKERKVVEVKFDGERAVKYVKEFCDIGPRVSGTEAIKKQQKVIEAHFKKLGFTVTRQEFKARQRSRKEETEFVNIVASWNPEKERRVILCAHYDTRPIADQEENRANWNKPFLSANDGTGGVALLMELGNHMKDVKCEFGVDFVFFDGEEYVFETGMMGGDRYFIGSEHFADEYTKSKGKRKYRYDAAILFDLCTAKGAELKVELHSYDAAKPLVDQVWGVAKDLGVKSFKYERGHEVLDDHIALIRAGIPAIDVIDFDYPHWHKLSDTADKIDPAQMRDVGKVIATWLQKIG